MLKKAYVKPPSDPKSNPDTVLNKIIATASFMIPSENRTALRMGNFYALIRLLAAIVSVAQKIADSIKTSFNSKI